MGKSPATNGDMKSTIFDYPWGEVARERGGPIKGIKEQILAVDSETGAYTRIVMFEPGFKFAKALQHSFWEELFLLEGHLTRLWDQHPLYQRLLWLQACGGHTRSFRNGHRMHPFRNDLV